MFDGLKDRLEGFTSDVEAEADVEVDSEEEEMPAAEVDEDAVAHGAEGDDGEEDDGEEDDGADGSDSDDETAVAEAGSEGTGTGAADDTRSTAAADADSAASADGEDGEAAEGRGFAKRAKLFASGKTVVDEDDLEPYLDDLEMALLRSDVEMGVAREILEGVRATLSGETRRRLQSTGNLARDALREALFDVISVGQFDFDERIAAAEKPVTIIFTGVNGVGKTTTIAKLARYLEERGVTTVLANGDTYRAGANEQLAEHAENLGKRVISHEQGSDPAAVLYDAVEYAEANDVDVVLGDTAGRLHTSEGLMDQLAKIDRVIDPDMTLFVDEAVAGKDAVNRAREFDDAAEVDGTILTKADADPQGGAAISIAHVTGKPILFLGTGQGYDDLERFDPEWIVDQLVGAE